MDQPGPGIPVRARDAVITQPGRVPPLRRGLFAALTLLAWTAFVWLVAPALTLLLWVVGLLTAYREAVTRWGDVDPSLLIGIGVTATAFCVLLVGWASLQRHRFVDLERRHRPADVAAAAVARSLRVAPDVAAALRSGRVVSLSMDDDGVPVTARCSDPAPRAVPAPLPAGLPHGPSNPVLDDGRQVPPVPRRSAGDPVPRP